MKNYLDSIDRAALRRCCIPQATPVIRQDAL